MAAAGGGAAGLAALAAANGVERWTTDLEAALANPDDTMFFDAATTQMRKELLLKAIDAGKDIAIALGIRLSTVKDHVHRVLDKTGLDSRAAIAAAWRGGG